MAECSTLTQIAPDIAKSLGGIGVGEDTVHETSYARDSRTVVEKPVRLPVGGIDTLVVVHTQVKVPDGTEAEQVVLAFLIYIKAPHGICVSCKFAHQEVA